MTRGYDELGRLVSESGSGGGSVSASITKQYDVLGRLSGFSSTAGQVGVSWDDRGLLVGVDVPGTALGDSTFGYDGGGRMTSRADASGFDSLTSPRGALKAEGLLICIEDARADVYPSGMSRQMGGGRRAYRHVSGRRPDRADLVDIFDAACCHDVVSVDDQLASVRRPRASG